MSGIRPSGLHINKPAVFGLIGLFLAILLLYKFLWAPEPLSLHTSGLKSFFAGSNDPGGEINNVDMNSKEKKLVPGGGGAAHAPVPTHQLLTWNLTQLPDPPVLDEEGKKKLAKKSEMFDIDVSGTKVPIYVQQTINNELKISGTILFLHGAAFSSQNWQDIGAMDQVASWGYRAVAIDLPGKGKSSAALEQTKVDQFLPSLVKTLQIDHPIIVSPSMSGMYSIPYLFTEPEKSGEKAAAFVPVAPVGTSGFTSSYPKSQLPTLIVYGANDKMGPTTLQDLRGLPNSIEAKVPDAGHPCYINQPAAFFKYLNAFLKHLKTPSS